MSLKFNVNGNGFKGAQVGTTAPGEVGVIGCYHNGLPYAPDRAAIRALMPHKWRKAFDRATVFWWNREAISCDTARLDVYALDGRLLTQVFCHAVREDSPGRVKLTWSPAPTGIIGPDARRTPSHGYQIWNEQGRKIMGGSFGPDREKCIAYALKLAAEKGLPNPELDLSALPAEA